MEAYSSFFQSLNKGHQKKYYPLISDVLAILPPVRESKDEEQLTKALVALIELAEVAPKMFKDHFRDLVKFSIAVVQDTELEDTPRQNALELMATFADHHPAMCRKDQNFTSEMVKQCLALMTDVGNDDDDGQIWNESEDVSIAEIRLQAMTDYEAARRRRERRQPCRWRTMYGPASQQARWQYSCTSGLLMDTKHDGLFIMAGKARCVDGYLSNLGGMPRYHGAGTHEST